MGSLGAIVKRCYKGSIRDTSWDLLEFRLLGSGFRAFFAGAFGGFKLRDLEFRVLSGSRASNPEVAGPGETILLHQVRQANNKEPWTRRASRRQGLILRSVRYMGVSENRGPQYSTLNSRILIIRTPQRGTPIFGNSHIACILVH